MFLPQLAQALGSSLPAYLAIDEGTPAQFPAQGQCVQLFASIFFENGIDDPTTEPSRALETAPRIQKSVRLIGLIRTILRIFHIIKPSW